MLMTTICQMRLMTIRSMSMSMSLIRIRIRREDPTVVFQGLGLGVSEADYSLDNMEHGVHDGAEVRSRGPIKSC
jgi:hypothetical protein